MSANFLESATGTAIIVLALGWGVMSGWIFTLPFPWPVVILAAGGILLWSFLTEKRIISPRTFR